MKLCVNCVLPENFPTLKLDSEGVCNYCRAYNAEPVRNEEKERFRNKFEKLIAEKGGRGSYDIIVAYSGGKDSTYTLDLLKHDYQLRVLAFTFDNGFVSGRAFENIKNVVESLGIDHLIYKPDFTLLKRVFTATIHHNPYSLKSLERASTICTSCMIFVKSAILKTALEKDIPFIGYGWSPGQAPIQSSVMKLSASFVKSTQLAAYESLKDILGEKAALYFLQDSDYENSHRFPYNIHPLAFSDYNEDLIYARIRDLGWAPPKDTDPNSTNCMMNAFAIHVHLDQFKFHPYAFEISGLIRSGVLSRKEGLERINAPENPQVISAVQKRLE